MCKKNIVKKGKTKNTTLYWLSTGTSIKSGGLN
jgi:hypothetical protein